MGSEFPEAKAAPLPGTALTIRDGKPLDPTLCIAQSLVRHYDGFSKHVAAWLNE